MSCTEGLREMVDWWCGSPSRWTHTSVNPVSLVRNWMRQFTGTPSTVPTNKPSTSHEVLGITRPCIALPNPSLGNAAQPWLVARVVNTRASIANCQLSDNQTMHELLCIQEVKCAIGRKYSERSRRSGRSHHGCSQLDWGDEQQFSTDVLAREEGRGVRRNAGTGSGGRRGGNAIPTMLARRTRRCAGSARTLRLNHRMGRSHTRT
jgi:hypothetical protein